MPSARRIGDAEFRAVAGDQRDVPGRFDGFRFLQAERDRVETRYARDLVDDDEDRTERLSDGLALAPSRHALGDRVEPLNDAVVVGRDDRVADRLERHLQQLAALGEVAFHLLPARHVLQRADQSGRPAVLDLGPTRRARPQGLAGCPDERQLEIERGARFESRAHGLLEDRTHVGREEREGRPERGLERRVHAEQAPRLVGPRETTGARVHLPAADPRDLPDPLEEILARAKRFLGPLARRDVGARALHPQRRAVAIARGDATPIEDPAPRTVLVADAGLHLVVVGLAFVMVDAQRDRLLQVVLVHQSAPGRAGRLAELGERVAGDLRPAFVVACLSRADVEFPGPRVGAFEDPRHPRPLVAQRGLGVRRGTLQRDEAGGRRREMRQRVGRTHVGRARRAIGDAEVTEQAAVGRRDRHP